MIFTYKIFKVTSFSSKVLEKWLHPQEIQRLNQFESQLDKNRFVSSRLNLKKTLSKYLLLVKPDQLDTTKNLNYLFIENQKIYFSISYSQSLGICVASQELIGVDLEFLLPRQISLEKIANPAELKFFKNTDKILKLYTIWCLKEACMKVVQVSFSFLDYQIIGRLNSRTFLARIQNYLLISFIYVRDDYIFVFTKFYDYNYPQFRDRP